MLRSHNILEVREAILLTGRKGPCFDVEYCPYYVYLIHLNVSFLIEDGYISVTSATMGHGAAAAAP